MAWMTLAATTWGTSPTIGTTFYYDMQRSGADMQYRVRVEISPLRVGGPSKFGYPIYLSVYLNNAAVTEGVTLKQASPTQWNDVKAWESGWTTVSNKTSGTTPLSIRLYSGSGSTRDQWYGYNLPIINAGTTLSFGTLTIGRPATITATRYNESYHYSITYALGSASGTIVEDSTAASVEWTPPPELLAQIPAAASASGALRVDTYDGTTLIGRIDYAATFAVADDVVPTIGSVVLSPSTASEWVSATGAYVQGYTALRVVTTASPGEGATIASITITGDAGSGSGDDWTSQVLTTAGNKAITITATDSRGRTATETRTITVLAYNAPTISNVPFERGSYSGGTWTPSTTGSDLKVSYRLTLSLTDQGNTADAAIVIGATQKWTGTISASGPQTVYLTGVTPDATQTMTISATDLVGGATAMATVIPTAKVLINKNFSLNALRIGGVAETKDSVEIDLPVKLHEPLGIASGGTSAADSAGARANLVVPQRPKLLWKGSLTGGSITVPGFSDYAIFAVELYASLVLARVSSSGYLSVGEFDISTELAGWATLSGAVMSVSSDTLTLLHNFYVSVNNTNWYQSAADTSNIWITAIYGLVRKDDLQGVTA